MRDQGQSPHLKIRTIKVLRLSCSSSFICCCLVTSRSAKISKRRYTLLFETSPSTIDIWGLTVGARRSSRTTQVWTSLFSICKWLSQVKRGTEEAGPIVCAYVSGVGAGVGQLAPNRPQELIHTLPVREELLGLEAGRHDVPSWQGIRVLLESSRRAHGREVQHVRCRVRLVVEAVMKEMKEDSNFTSYITVT